MARVVGHLSVAELGAGYRGSGDTDVLSLPDRALASIRDRLNATPRKCLGWRTPAEAFRDHLMEPPSFA